MSLPTLLGIGKEEWTAFEEGRLLSPSLLLKLLTYRYRKQKQIQVNQVLRRIEVDDTVKVPLPPLLAPESVLVYELSVIVYTTSIGLLIRGKAYPFILYVGAPSLVDEFADDNEVEYRVNVKGSEYFIFDFLGVYTGIEEKRLATSEPKELAAAMIDELSRPRYFRESLITLYKEIDQLLTSGGGGDDISRKVETKKRAFYQIVVQTIQIADADNTAPTNDFLIIPEPQRPDDIALDAARSDVLFKEILPLVEFMWLVVATTPSPQQATLVIRGRAYTAAQVQVHLFFLAKRILSHVDRLNAKSITINEVMAHQLGFTQREYERLTSQDASFISYNVMAHFFRDKLLLVGGLRRLLQLKRQGELMLWVTGDEEESNLVTLYRPEKMRPYQQSIYVHSQLLATTDVQKTLQEANIRPFKQQIDMTDTENMDAPHYSTWYIALLIQRLSSELPPPPQIREILLTTQSRQVIEVQQGILMRIQQDILSLVLTEPRAIPVPKVERYIVQSKLSNLLELRDTGKFVNDAVISDIVKTMRINPRFYVFDPLFWSRTVRTGLVKNVLGKFMDPTIEVLLVPINENNTHWSLGIIDLRLGVVSFYTSVKNRNYFKEFVSTMTALLVIQTPGVKYQFIELTGQECQPSDSLDCSIYVLNKISQLCVLPDKRVFYTRKSVAVHIEEGLLKQAKDGVWYNFSADLLDFMQKYPLRRKEYNRELILLLLAFYEEKKITDLFLDLFTQGKLVKSKSTEIEAQFKARLGPEKNIDVFT